MEILNNPDELCIDVSRQINVYFAGEQTKCDLPLRVTKTTDFQKAAWQPLTCICFQEAISYGEQAKRINKTKAVRAVSGTNGKIQKEWILKFEHSF